MARTAAPTGSSGARRACIPGSARRARRSRFGQLVGELEDLTGGQLDLVDLTGTGRGPPPSPGGGQAGQGADRPTAHHRPIRRRRGSPRPRRRSEPWPRPCGPAAPSDRRPTVGLRCRAHPAAGPGRWPRSWPRRGARSPQRPLRGCPRPRSIPSVGPGPVHTPAHCPMKQSRASSSPPRTRTFGPHHPLQAFDDLGAVGRIAQRGRGQGDDDVRSGFGEPRPQPLGGRHRRRDPVPGDGPALPHAQAEVQQRPPVQNRGERVAAAPLHTPADGTSCSRGPTLRLEPPRRERSLPGWMRPMPSGATMEACAPGRWFRPVPWPAYLCAWSSVTFPSPARGRSGWPCRRAVCAEPISTSAKETFRSIAATSCPATRSWDIVDALGPHASRFAMGDRVGIAWLAGTCGRCQFCRRGDENLCARGDVHRLGP